MGIVPKVGIFVLTTNISGCGPVIPVWNELCIVIIGTYMPIHVGIINVMKLWSLQWNSVRKERFYLFRLD